MSCEETEEKKAEPYVAQVGDEKLLVKELKSEMPAELKGEDSIQFVNNFINQWVYEQVVYQKALEILPESAKDVNYQLEKYKRSLLIFKYEEEYLQERMDTLVEDELIEEYYNVHSEDFILRDYIVKAAYSKFPLDAPDLDKMKSWYRLKKEEDWASYKNHVVNYGVDVYIDTTQWIYFDDLLTKLPSEDINKSSFLKYKKHINIEDDAYVYYLTILDVKLQDEISPLEFERDKIKGILLSIRMKEMKKELEKQLMNDAKNANKIKVNT